MFAREGFARVHRDMQLNPLEIARTFLRRNVKRKISLVVTIGLVESFLSKFPTIICWNECRGLNLLVSTINFARSVTRASLFLSSARDPP